MAATHQHQFMPESDEENGTSGEPAEERKIDHKQVHTDQSEEPDHGRHAIDRSRPSSFVRKNH